VGLPIDRGDHGTEPAVGGSYVPLPFYGTGRRVRSVMIELRRDLYMEETTGDPHAGFERIRCLVGTLIEAAVAARA